MADFFGNLKGNLESLGKTISEKAEVVSKKKSQKLSKKSFKVKQHIRTMAKGKHHSTKKAVEAAKIGIELLPNQTIVESYTKCDV